MFEKKIYIQAESLVIGKKEIPWPQILGLRSQGGKVLEFISPNFPRAEIFLKGGKVVPVSNRNIFFINNENSNEPQNISSSEAISLIKSRAINAKPILNKWLEWRLLLPLFICEVIALGIGIAKKLTLEDLVMFVISAGMVGAVLGIIWERKERRKLLVE
jgi:hypothetical protein